MPKIEYPKFLFHRDSPHPRLVRTVEEHGALAAEGWEEDPDTAAGRPRPDGGGVPGAPWPGDLPLATRTLTLHVLSTKQEYPKFLFHATQKPVIVKSEAEHLALGPGWYETPDEAVLVPTPEIPEAGEAGTTHNSTPEIRTPPPPPPPADTPLDITKLKAAEALLYLETVTALETLAEADAKEERGQNRVTVRNAIAARVAALTAPPPTE